jgi:cytidylate kinase
MKIFICGFSASGKSYLTEFIGKRLNLKVIHTSDLLKQISKGNFENILNIENTKMNMGWYEHSNLDSLRKSNDTIDIKLDKYLLDFVNNNDDFVMDSWTLPYLYKGGFKVWLKSDLSERSKRMSTRDNIDLNEALKLVVKKDTFSINKFKKLYSFDLGKDLSNFDFVLDTTNLSLKSVHDIVLEEIKTKFKV